MCVCVRVCVCVCMCVCVHALDEVLQEVKEDDISEELVKKFDAEK